MGKIAGHEAEKGIGEDVLRRSFVRNLGSSPLSRSRNGAAAFYIETLALLAVFTAVTLLLVQGFLLAGKLSRKADALSRAVHLAENAAEMTAASVDEETLFRLLDEAGNACVLEQSNQDGRRVYRARYDSDAMPAKDGVFYVDVSWTPEQDGLVRSTVDVYREGEPEPVYGLELAVYVSRKSINPLQAEGY